MSVKDVKKHEKSKKASDVHSQRHDDEPTQSISSLSIQIQQFKNEISKLQLELEDGQNRMMYFRQRMNKLMGFDDQYSKEAAKIAEGQLQMWQSLCNQILVKQMAANDKLRQIYRSPDKARKKRNYVLKKVYEPPSDNE